jgi:5-methylcytosine-specific restriction endonuclease McrA
MARENGGAGAGPEETDIQVRWRGTALEDLKLLCYDCGARLTFRSKWEFYRWLKEWMTFTEAGVRRIYIGISSQLCPACNLDRSLHYLRNRAMPYKEYLKSEFWKNQRTRILAIWDKCDLCQGTDNLELHHWNYENVGAETREDLAVLCRKCHKDVHEMLSSGRGEEQDDAVEEKNYKF